MESIWAVWILTSILLFGNLGLTQDVFDDNGFLSVLGSGEAGLIGVAFADEEDEEELEGTIITIISDTSFTLETEDNGTCTIDTDDSTKLKDFAEVSDLKEGDEVEVEGVLTEDCVLFATEIELEDDDSGLFVAVIDSVADITTLSQVSFKQFEVPTLGVDNGGKRIVDNGFSYNGKSVDVERYFTSYPLVTVQTGKQNVAEFKIYDNQGPDSISHFELAFGLASGESIGMSKAVINWDKTFDGIETVTLYDPENVLDKIKVTTSEGSCSEELDQKCLIVKVKHTFRAPLDFDILGTNVWDAKRNAWQNYYNHGIEVVGESLNPPKEYDGINKGQIYHLTETGKTSAVDEFGNSWSLEYGQWIMNYIPNKKIDGLAMNGYTRDNSKFDMYKYGQYLLAENKLVEICSECFDDHYSEINDIFAYEYPKTMSSLENSEIQKNMIIESEKAEKIMAHLLDPILHLKSWTHFKSST